MCTMGTEPSCCELAGDKDQIASEQTLLLCTEVLVVHSIDPHWSGA